MPLIEPVRWKFGKRLMPHLLPCSCVILFVRISEICFDFNFPYPGFFFPKPSARGLSAHYMASQRGERQGFQDDFSSMLQNLAETAHDLARRSRMPNFAPQTTTGLSSERTVSDETGIIGVFIYNRYS